MASEEQEPAQRPSATARTRGFSTPDLLMRFGGRLHDAPMAWNAAAFGLRMLSQPRRGAQVRRYLRDNDVRRLRLGSGRHLDQGWLSADLVPLALGIVYMDANKPLPLPDDSFDFILCEHMIEHISLGRGRALLSECRRVLRPGGVLRLVTPDLDRLLQMTSGAEHDDATRFYVSTMNSVVAEIPVDDRENAVYMLNRLMHDWGHQFLYNQVTITTLLHDAGFAQVVQCKPLDSAHPDLVGMDRHHEEVGEQMNEIESLLLEAEVPGDGPTRQRSA